MKDKLEAILAGLKIVGVALALALAYFLVFQPKTVAQQIETIGTELRQLEDAVEYSLLFVTVKTSGTDKEELARAQEILAEQNNALLCGGDNKNTCTEAAREAANSVLTDLKAQEKITIGQKGVITVPEAWIVLASSYRKADDAITAVEQLNIGSLDYDVIEAANRYRVVAVFNNQEAAQSAVSIVNSVVSRDDSYVRFLTVWCDDHKRKKFDERSFSYLSCDRTKQLAAKK